MPRFYILHLLAEICAFHTTTAKLLRNTLGNHKVLDFWVMKFLNAPGNRTKCRKKIQVISCKLRVTGLSSISKVFAYGYVCKY